VASRASGTHYESNIMTKRCAHCGADFVLTPDKPGKIYECWDCAEDVPRINAAQSADLSGAVGGLLKAAYPNGFAALDPGYRGSVDAVAS